jgi:transposase
MLTGRPKPTLELTMEEHTQLKSLAASRTLPHALVCRARVVLWSAGGQSNTQIAKRLGWAEVTVGKWRQRFLEQHLAGLYDELRPGQPRSIADEQIAILLKRTLSRKPAGATHWSVRQAAHDSGHFQIHRASCVSRICGTAAESSTTLAAPEINYLRHRLLVLLCYKIDTPIAKLRAGNEGMC